MSGLLWVAEIQEGSETRIAMLPVEGSSPSVNASTTPAITLHASLIYALSDPILDVALFGNGDDQHMVVLSPQFIRLFAQTSGTWTAIKSFGIAHTQPFPRDTRGRIVSTPEHLFDAYLPGVVCSAQRMATPGTWRSPAAIVMILGLSRHKRPSITRRATSLRACSLPVSVRSYRRFILPPRSRATGATRSCLTT